MNNIYNFAIVLLLMSFFSCQGPDKNYIVKVRFRQLTESQIYNSDLVADAIFDAQELVNDSIKNKSSQLFLQGIDAIKNKNKAALAIKYFKKSILLLPDVKTYYELACAYMELQPTVENINQAEAALDVAEDLHFQPVSMIYYKRACIQNMQVKDSTYFVDNVVGTLSIAFYHGFNDTARLAQDKFLKNIVNTPAYKTKEAWVKLFKKTFKFTGGEIVNEFLMSIGYLKGAHDEDCPIHQKVMKCKPMWAYTTI